MRIDTPELQYAALRQVATAVARGVDAESVFALVAERTARLMEADGSGIVRFDPDGTGRLVGQWSREGLLDGEVPRDIDLSGGSTVARVYQSGRPARVERYADIDDPRARFLATAYECGVAVPVRLGLGVWGAVAVASVRPDAFPPDADARLADFAELVALAVASPDPGSRAGIEALLDTILVSAPVGIAFLDHELRLVRVNHAFASVTDLRVDQHAGAQPEFEPGRYPHLDMRAARQVREHGVPVLDLEVEVEGTAGDAAGRRHWLTSYYPVWPARGGMIGVGAVIVDITEQRRATEALRRERDYSAALIEAMQDGLAVAAPDGTLIDVNQRFCAMTGFARDDLIGAAPPYPFWPRDERRHAARRAFENAQAGRTGDNDLSYRRADGSSLPVVVSHAPLRDPDGGVGGTVATVRDVTEHRRAVEERNRLLTAERQARTRIEILQGVTAALSQALTPQQVSRVAVAAAAPLVGALAGELLVLEDGLLRPVGAEPGMSLFGAGRAFPADGPTTPASVAATGWPQFIAVVHPSMRAQGGRTEGLRADAGSLAVVPLMIEGRTLGVLAFGFTHRVFGGQDRSVLVTIGDLCAQALERAGLYDAARARAEALRQRDALRSAVLRGVSHEFRSPLTAISNAAAALERVEDAALRRELVGVVGAETRRLDRFVANILDLSRLQGGALQPRLDSCAADELVAGALEAVAALDPTDVRVRVAPDIPLVRADPVLTERILVNLVHNAIRHGGADVRLDVDHDAGWVRFSVADGGPGVAAVDAEQVFEPFVAQRERGGLGLGLGLSRGLAEIQGGALVLVPSDRGARFVLTLPIDEWGAP